MVVVVGYLAEHGFEGLDGVVQDSDEIVEAKFGALLEQVEKRLLKLLRLEGNSPSGKVASIHRLLMVLHTVLLHQLLEVLKLSVNFLHAIFRHTKVHEDWLLCPVIRCLEFHHLALSSIFKELLLHFLIHSIVLRDGDHPLIDHSLQLETAFLSILCDNSMRLSES